MTRRNDAPMPLADRRTARAPAREGGFAYALWGLAGFLLGALFWHIVGFWDFVASVVHRRDHPPTIIERLLAGPSDPGIAGNAQTQADREARAHDAARTCTTLTRDVMGRTVAHPCMVVIRNVPHEPDIAASMPLASTGARLDRTAAGR